MTGEVSEIEMGPLLFVHERMKIFALQGVRAVNHCGLHTDR